MVFESVVVDVLNRFLGSYVENLDPSQLKIGIFGGDVDLKDLIIKPSALDDLNLPFQVTYGFIKKLTLKIPWKDLYGAPVVASIDGVYAVIVPSTSTKYDEQKEFRASQDAKQKALMRVEELRAKELELKNPSKKPEKEDTLVEKIVAQVVKNVQVKIANIHCRYEDSFTDPARPFSFGFTLSKLNFETTDENWKPQMVDRNVHIFRKLVFLDSFSFYWNPKVRLISHLSSREIMSELIDSIARENFKPPGINYLVAPITSTVRMRINQKPEREYYEMPSITIDITIEDISMKISKNQYHDIMALMDSMNRMWLADKYRKHRPAVPLQSNAKQWWKFAFTSILEEQVRPRRQQWNKDFLLEHIRKVKEYKTEYANKLTKQKESDRLKKLEEELDLFNIILARRQAEVEIAKQPKIEAKKGWLGGWWGGGSEKAANPIVKNFQKEMTADEKAKLYAAIDYNENQVPADFPITFVDKKLNFLLKTLSINIDDDSTKNVETVLKTTLKEVSSSIDMRPKGEAMKIGAKIEGFHIEGFPKTEIKRRTLLTSDKNAGTEKATQHLLDVTFETNPLEGGCDQRIRVNAEPVEIFYDVRSVEAVVDVFRPPDTVSLDNIQNTAVSSFRNFKSMSATGLQHAIDNKPSLDILVTVKPSYILIFEDGKIDDNKNVLVFSMGQLSVKSKPRNKDAPTVKDMFEAGTGEKEVLEALFNEAYDKMQFHLSAAELMIVPGCEAWRECVKSAKKSSNIHILQPTDLYINVDICFLPNEKRIPKMKISGKLPCLEIDLSDETLIKVLKILETMGGQSPPQSKIKEMGQSTAVEEVNIGTAPAASQAALIKDRDAENIANLTRDKDKDELRMNQADIYDAVFVDLAFEISKFLVRVQQSKVENGRSVANPLLVFATNELRVSLLMHLADMFCEVTLKDTVLTHLAYTLPDAENPLKVLESSVDPGTGYMLKLSYTQVEPKHPDFRTRFNSTLAAVKCKVGEMTFALHQEAIKSLIEFSTNLTDQLSGDSAKASASSTLPVTAERSQTAGAVAATASPSPNPMALMKKASKKPLVTQFSAHASLAALKIILCRSRRLLAQMDVTGVEAGVEQTKRSMTSHVVLRDISMIDPNEGSKHPQIISITGDEVLNLKISQFEESGAEGYTKMDKVDMMVDATIGRMHFVFLWKFSLDLMSFFDAFQAAKDKVADATAAAAAAAKGAAEMAYEKAYKMALNVIIKAPVIYVPQSSFSQRCLVMDFGVLSIGNTFQPGPSTPANSVPVLYENTKISIDNLMMYRCDLKPLKRDPVENTQFSIMDPVSFGLEVQRNLTAAAHKELPELRMKGTVTSVNLKVGEDDYAALMKTLSENFAESPPGYSAPADPHASVDQASQVQAPTGGKPSGAVAVSNKEVVTVERHRQTRGAEEDEEKLARMEIFFTLQEIKLELFTRRTAEKCSELCALNIAGFKLCGIFYHDDSYWVNMFLVNLLLDDERACRRDGIRRLISKVEESEKMIDIIYQAENTGAFAAIVNVSKMRFVYSASLNMALLDLLNQANVNAENQLEKERELSEKRTTGQSVLTSTAAAQAAAAPAAPNKTVPFTLILQIVQPDVVLVADLENPSSACIIFKSSVNIRVKQDENKMNTRLQLHDIEMFVSSLDSTGARSEILRRCDIVVEMDQDSKSQNAKIDVTPIEIHMTPSAVEIVSASLSALSPAPVNASLDDVPDFFDPTKIWVPQRFDNLNLWFTKKDATRSNIEKAKEAVEIPAGAGDDSAGAVLSQEASFSMEQILITIEQGSGAQTMPMLLVSSSLKGDARNWASQLELDSVLNCSVSYYNERYAVWEPMLESVETVSGARKPWETTMEVRAAPPTDREDGISALDLDSKFKVVMKCSDNLEFTVTKTALQVLQSLGQEFSQALQKKQDMVDSRKVDAPYCVKNSLGMPLTLNVEDSNFMIITTEDEAAVIEHGKKLHLDFRNRSTVVSFSAEPTKDVNEAKEDKLFFNAQMNFGNISSDRKLNVNHTAKRVFRVPFRSYPGDDWSFVVDVKSHYGSRLVTLCSIVNVYNAFSVPMDVYYRRKDELEKCASVPPKSLSHIPLVALYTRTNELLFKPAGDRYQMAEEGFQWKKEGRSDRLIVCKATNPSKASLFMNIITSVEQLPYDDSPTEKCAVYTLRLAPTVIVNNLLPLMVDINSKESNVHFELNSGGEIELWNSKPTQSVLNIRLDYAGVNWHCAKVLDDEIEELSAITLKDSNNAEHVLDLAMHCETKEGSKVLSIHCPFWMVNKTQTDLYYKKGKRSKADSAPVGPKPRRQIAESSTKSKCCSCFNGSQPNEGLEDSVRHAQDDEEPLLFTFGAKNMFAPKKKVCVRIFDSDWSSKTPMDAVGQSGTVMAKSSKTDQIYPLSVHIALSSTTLTRIVTFTPFYMVTNNSKFGAIEIRENSPNAEWILVEQNKCVPLWPMAVAKIELIARYAGSTEITVPFGLKESSLVLLRLDNKYAGIYMSCQVEESATVVSFTEYEQGLSAVFLVNDTDENVYLRQEFNGSSSRCVQVGQSVHYAWEDPRENRQLVCWVYDNDVCKVGPLTDASGQIKLPQDKFIFWASFLDGKQRVLYFSKDSEHMVRVEKVGQLERCNTEFDLEYRGIGISLVDDEPKRREILYVSVSGSGVQWLSRSKHKPKYKPINAELNSQVEAEYQKYLNIAKAIGPANTQSTPMGKYRLDFNRMQLTTHETKNIRRSCEPGLWLRMKLMDTQTAVHLKVHRIQIDNQIRDCQFPVVLSPIVYKKTIGEQKIPKPFIELSVIMRQFPGASLRQIKYCKMLVQEFAIRVDMCFINSLLAFVTLSAKKTTYAELMERDVSVARTSLREIASVHAVQGQRDYIDYMHLSPMKIHLSFSMYAGGSAPPPPEGAFSGVKLLLQSFGVTLTDIQGAVLKLDYFERSNDFLTMNQLSGDVASHYKKQALKQIYVVILGLDVIGNPVGLVMGISAGVGDLFYEPFQGAIQGPEEFVAGLAQGVASLIGHTVGGAADAMGKITGALGKGVAALTMDEDYQKKRRMERNKRPQDITEGIAQSGKDLVMGFYDGVTGVVTKPLEGAREDGIGGFMKGMGKGLIGIVARPASGVVDFASGTFASVKRATELEEVALPVRPPRLVRDNGIVQPYNRMEAEGHQLLQEVENGKYAATDAYFTHLSVCSDGRNFVIITSHRILFVEKGDIFGHWKCEWEYMWEQIRPPMACSEGVKVLLKEPKRKNMFQQRENGKIISIPDRQMAEWLCQQINRAMKKNG
ncbi:vacuolar protein sorting-associated protein 13 [Galendromus occidentalis]|uniref:Vacuolar protein sorting-associated protein 13 n=1 Tax=Galendromus occidentalis TaxID=34638 RepID=A0AAJ7WJ72_9ACAR|nr:vacuolar protein sorting-associated protein 13 [Galendromus occidentalis]